MKNLGGGGGLAAKIMTGGHEGCGRGTIGSYHFGDAPFQSSQRLSWEILLFGAALKCKADSLRPSERTQ